MRALVLFVVRRKAELTNVCHVASAIAVFTLVVELETDGLVSKLDLEFVVVDVGAARLAAAVALAVPAALAEENATGALLPWPS